MAFGFFKKENKVNKADYIYKNAKIYTQDPDQPWAEAVACKDGKIIAVGTADVEETFGGDETEIVDLDGAYVLPGFIDINGTPAYRSFKDFYTELDDLEDFDDFLGNVANLAQGGFGSFGVPEPIFVIARNVTIPEDMDGETLRGALDERTEGTPFVAMLPDVGGVFMNTVAADIVKQYIEENELPQVTISAILDALEIVDFEEVQQNAINIATEYCEKGYTSVVNNGHMEYFDSAYTDILLEMHANGVLKQRFFGKISAATPASENLIQARLRQKMVMCQELDGMINENGLLVKVGNKFDNLEEQLTSMCKAAAEAGFNVKVCVDDDESARTALEVLYNLHSKGYKKTTFVLAHHAKFTEEERLNNELGTGIVEACPITMDYIVGSEAGSISEAIDTLTYDAAIELGLIDELGSIEEGKNADFVVFDENPFDCGTIKLFRRLNAKKTIIGGVVVYDEDEDIENEWYSILVNQQY